MSEEKQAERQEIELVTNCNQLKRAYTDQSRLLEEYVRWRYPQGSRLAAFTDCKTDTRKE